ncbi:MAG: methyltransferase [Cytophagaceae bacterium]|nr:methyltransferase [Cytophagaceae bacterium]MDW8455835.1 methyltransferase [Cytophagaceae bacterium]
MQDIFRFKQFEIDQQKASMKICTDSCLFGALIDVANRKKILDIGTGTGLLALMMAQKCDAQIYAIEPDEINADLAEKNFNSSPWKNNLRLLQYSVQQFTQDTDLKFDLIVSNPPFYEKYLPSGNKRKDIAKHNSDLSYQELVSAIQSLLHNQGICWILLPVRQMSDFEEISAQHGIYVSQRFFIKNRPYENPIRVVSVFEKKYSSYILQSEITIRDKDEKHHVLFKNLMRPFYLYL